jgi:hypothetical protein
MQELMTYAGHLDCYGKSNEVLSCFLSVNVSSTRVYRVTSWVSEGLKEEEKANRLLPPVSKEEVLYVGVDGSIGDTWIKNWIIIKAISAEWIIENTGQLAAGSSARDLSNRLTGQ